MDHISRRLAFLAVAIGFTLALGTAGFIVIEKYPPLDAFYMTLTTITTVGYREVHDLSRAGRIFNSFLIFFGVTTMFLAVGLVTQTAIELELHQFFDKRRMKGMIQNLRDHYILCGFGRVGRGAADELAMAGAPFVVVDNREDRIARATRAGMAAMLADATRDETLRDAGIERARGLIATLSTDADNLFVVLSAKALNPSLKVCARIAEEEAEQKMRRAGADFVFAPYNLVGHRMAQSMTRPHVAHFIDFTTKNIGLDVGIEQVRVGEHSEFAARSLAQIQFRRELGVIVLAIRRADGAMLFNPPAEAVISVGDYLIVMGEPESLRRLERLLTLPGEAARSQFESPHA
jgi:voltage-gated potassium channel